MNTHFVDGIAEPDAIGTSPRNSTYGSWDVTLAYAREGGPEGHYDSLRAVDTSRITCYAAARFSGIFLDLEPDSLEDILAGPEDEIEALLLLLQGSYTRMRRLGKRVSRTFTQLSFSVPNEETGQLRTGHGQFLLNGQVPL